MNKRQRKKQYPVNCERCSYYEITKNLITHNGCGKCPNREWLENRNSNKEMICDICKKVVKPLDAHMGKLDGKLITTHIDCWNKEVSK